MSPDCLDRSWTSAPPLDIFSETSAKRDRTWTLWELRGQRSQGHDIKHWGQEKNVEYIQYSTWQYVSAGVGNPTSDCKYSAKWAEEQRDSDWLNPEMMSSLVRVQTQTHADPLCHVTSGRNRSQKHEGRMSSRGGRAESNLRRTLPSSPSSSSSSSSGKASGWVSVTVRRMTTWGRGQTSTGAPNQDDFIDRSSSSSSSSSSAAAARGEHSERGWDVIWYLTATASPTMQSCFSANLFYL